MSNAIINTNMTEYQIYMSRVKSREQQGDQIRSAVKEINNLKAELREIKNLIKDLGNK
jgi:prefoldin subunit 5